MNEICHSCQKRTIVCDAHQLCEICEDARDVVTARCFAKVTIAQLKKKNRRLDMPIPKLWIKACDMAINRKLDAEQIYNDLDAFAKTSESLSFDGLMPMNYARFHGWWKKWHNDNSR